MFANRGDSSLTEYLKPTMRQSREKNPGERGIPILEVIDLSCIYPTSHGPLEILTGIYLQVARGETVAIIGPSGSGKTTLLGLCAGLDVPTGGEVILSGRALSRLGENERAALRSQEVGFVFQNFQLIPTLTALENVSVPLELQGERRAGTLAAQSLERVGLAARQDHYPVQLSGGEQQRVALARAFVNEPAILFADEPTGNLDEETGSSIEDLLFALNRDSGTTLILVTHNLDLAGRADRVLKIRKGRIET